MASRYSYLTLPITLYLPDQPLDSPGPTSTDATPEHPLPFSIRMMAFLDLQASLRVMSVGTAMGAIQVPTGR